MKKGFYYFKSSTDERCYYLTGEKKGNKWIYIGGIGGKIPDKFYVIEDPEWTGLNWTCIPTENELKNYSYSETNPTKYTLNT